MMQEKKLAFAVLQRAILDALRTYQYLDGDHKSEAARDARDARKWFRDKSTAPFSFLWICDLRR
jgi:hypothetical protein